MSPERQTPVPRPLPQRRLRNVRGRFLTSHRLPPLRAEAGL